MEIVQSLTKVKCETNVNIKLKINSNLHTYIRMDYYTYQTT